MHVRSAGVILCLILTLGVGMARAGNAKIGYVDFQKALNEVDEGRQAKAELERTFQQKQNEVNGMQRELEAMQKGLEKDRQLLSAEALRSKEDDYRKKFLELTQRMNGAKAELADREAQTTRGILGALRAVVQKIGTAEQYDMVLEKSQDVVLYSPANADITAQVIREYNKLPKSQRRGK